MSKKNHNTAPAEEQNQENETESAAAVETETASTAPEAPVQEAAADGASACQ